MLGVGSEVDQASAALLRGGVVKICGLREPEHAMAAAASGADILGFIFAPARRQVSAVTARTCIDAARLAAGVRDVVAVGVFVDALPADILVIAEEAGLDAIQLHGSEPAQLAFDLGVPAIKALRPPAGAALNDVIAEIERYESAAHPPIGYLIDGFVEGFSGGAGVRADWNLAAEVCAARPVMLAGGLDPENVGDAIRRTRPLGVDVSSGVEIDGIKNATRIEEFVRAAREAFLAQS